MTERVEAVPAALADQRLDRVVAMVADVSRAVAAELVGAGRVRVDGVVRDKVAHRVAEGAEVSVDVAGLVVAEARPVADEGVEVPVVHVDDAIVVVDKPAGLVVHPGAGHDHGTLVSGLLARFPEIAEVGDPARPGIVHRLDRETSGLLVVARTPAAYDALVAQLSARTVERRYVAVVVGHPESPRGLVDAPIGRSPRQPTLMAVRADGKEARTRYEVEETFAEPRPLARLTCRLETGRTHQIRVHMRAIGHPILGDVRYGGGVGDPVCPRPFLHAAELGLVHPVTGEQMGWSAELPADLAGVLAGLRATT